MWRIGPPVDGDGKVEEGEEGVERGRESTLSLETARIACTRGGVLMLLLLLLM